MFGAPGGAANALGLVCGAVVEHQGLGLERGGRTSLVAQWLRIRLPMQGTRVRALVWEDSTCPCTTTTEPGL